MDFIFLSEQTQQIAYNGDLSNVQPVSFDVPQGSVLGPLLYVLYTEELFHVVSRHQLRLHMYADNSQVNITAPAYDAYRRGRPSLSRHSRHQRLDKGQPTTAEPIQDTGYVAGYQTATGQHRHQRCPAAVHRRNSR